MSDGGGVLQGRVWTQRPEVMFSRRVGVLPGRLGRWDSDDGQGEQREYRVKGWLLGTIH